MNELSTSETDAVASRLMCNVSANFARKLKYERDEARKESMEQARLLGISGEQERRLIAERDEAKKKYDIEATEHVLNINKICNQRDAAMDVLEEISLYLSSGIGDENTTAQQYKERILDGIKHLAGHAWEERCKYEKLWKEAEDAKIKAERERDEVLIELEEYRSIAENIGAEKAVSEKEKAIRESDAAIDALRKIEEIYLEGDDTYEGWFSMGLVAREYLKDTYESRTNQTN